MLLLDSYLRDFIDLFSVLQALYLIVLKVVDSKLHISFSIGALGFVLL